MEVRPGPPSPPAPAAPAALSRAAAFLAPFTVLRVCRGAAARFGRRFSRSPLHVHTPGFRADSAGPPGASSCAGGGLARTRPGLGWPERPCRLESLLSCLDLWRPVARPPSISGDRLLPRHKALQKATARGPFTQGETWPPSGCAGQGRPPVCSACGWRHPRCRWTPVKRECRPRSSSRTVKPLNWREGGRGHMRCEPRDAQAEGPGDTAVARVPGAPAQWPGALHSPCSPAARAGPQPRAPGRSQNQGCPLSGRPRQA